MPLLPVPDNVANLKTTSVGKGGVQEKKVRAERRDGLKSFLASSRNLYVIAVLCHEELKGQKQIRFVVDDEDSLAC